MELHTESRRDLCPDPDIDPIQAIFYSILHDVPPKSGQREVTGVVIMDHESASISAVDTKGQGQDNSSATQGGAASTSSANQRAASTSSANQRTCRGQQLLLEKTGLPGVTVNYVSDEKQLIEAFVKIVHQ